MVNIYKIKFSLLQQEILRYLFVNAGKSFNARKISKSLNRTLAGVLKSLPFLEKENLIKLNKDKDSKQWKIELNRENQKTIFLKRCENLKIFYETGIVQYLEENFPGSIIILFGSYSKGEDTFNSDIDIAIIGSKEKKINLTKYGKILEKEITINFFESLDKINKNLRSNILSGITLIGVAEI